MEVVAVVEEAAAASSVSQEASPKLLDQPPTQSAEQRLVQPSLLLGQQELEEQPLAI